MKKPHLTDGYLFKGFRPYRSFDKIEFPYESRIIKLKRIQKKRHVLNVGNSIMPIMIKKLNWSETYLVVVCLFIFNLNIAVLNAIRLVK
jgi:hypothetical protein